MTTKRIELMRKIMKIGNSLNLLQSESLARQIIDSAVSDINDNIVDNESVSDNSIESLTNLINFIQAAIEKKK